MKTNSIIFLFLSIFSFYLFSCKKNNPTPVDTNNNSKTAVALSFNSLNAAKTGIVIGEETTIKAEATGENLTYSWQASAGTIVGQGAQVSYGSTCTSCRGDNTISCTVSDGKASETKSILISIR